MSAAAVTCKASSRVGVRTSMRGRALSSVVHPFSFREYLRHLGREPVKAFDRLPSRERSAVEERKREHWARQFREHGGLVAMRAGHALYEYARRVRPRARNGDRLTPRSRTW